MKSQPDIIMNSHKDYAGCCVEFKNPTNNYPSVKCPKRDETPVQIK